jgi:hypothetical protein
MTVFFSLNWHLRRLYEVFSPRNFHQFHSGIKYPMRDEEFLKKLTEVAEWQRVRVDLEGSGAHKKPVDNTVPTVIKVLKVRCLESACEDCGQTVCGRRVERKLYRYGAITAFKQRCVNCDRHLDPYTRKFTMDGTEASRAWTDYARYHSHYKTKK